mmetsp:Transcript_10782/g.28857  ORF Transcript_10782/g.28857 Transcript_10782/m.28857 type:complete len:204 (+) Transcript_10782:746-1357(+)
MLQQVSCEQRALICVASWGTSSRAVPLHSSQLDKAPLQLEIARDERAVVLREEQRRQHLALQLHKPRVPQRSVRFLCGSRSLRHRVPHRCRSRRVAKHDYRISVASVIVAGCAKSQSCSRREEPLARERIDRIRKQRVRVKGSDKRNGRAVRPGRLCEQQRGEQRREHCVDACGELRTARRERTQLLCVEKRSHFRDRMQLLT